MDQKGEREVATERISLEEAVRRLVEALRPSGNWEEIPLEAALGRVTAWDLEARIDQPPFDRSPLDGYALRHEDTCGASAEHPVRLRVAGCSYAGDPPAAMLRPGEAVRLMTGSPIPPGADCVIRQEDTRAEDGMVAVFDSLERHQNYCFRGEDVHRGALLLPRGTRLDPPAIGVLAGQGMTAVAVTARLPVGILSTGSELAPAGGPLGPGKIYDSNAAMLAARITQAGASPQLGAGTADDPALLAAGIAALLERCPLVVTTGGVSVGAHDYLPEVARILRAEILFHGLQMKPGSPAMACRVGGGLLLALSGNPFAAAAGFELMGMPLLRHLMGQRTILARRVRGRLAEGFPKASRGRRFVRAHFTGETFHLPEGHSSGMLASMVGCNCLVDIPAGSPALMPGSRAEAVMIE